MVAYIGCSFMNVVSQIISFFLEIFFFCGENGISFIIIFYQYYCTTTLLWTYNSTLRETTLHYYNYFFPDITVQKNMPNINNYSNYYYSWNLLLNLNYSYCFICWICTLTLSLAVFLTFHIFCTVAAVSGRRIEGKHSGRDLTNIFFSFPIRLVQS